MGPRNSCGASSREWRDHSEPDFGSPVAAIASLLTLATGITWLFWQYRVTANVWRRGIDINITPASAYGAERRRSGWVVAAWWVAFVTPLIVIVTVAVSRFVDLASGLKAPEPGVVTTIDRAQERMANRASVPRRPVFRSVWRVRA